ncbi:MAG: ATP-binding cassette domain-containing protein [Saccharospirillum sp.]
MTLACLSATGVSVAFDPYPPIFRFITLSLAAEPVALIGPNGSGKTLLAECLAGVRAPSEGEVVRHRPVAFLSQQAAEQPFQGSIAEFLGVAAPLAALRRLLAGQGQVEDVTVLAERWTLEQELAEQLTAFHLEPALLEAPVSVLSGGQRTRLRLLALARLGDAYLILDEPTNHLDQAGRQWLADWVFRRTAGTLVITHDQALLHQFDQLLELRDGQLHHHGAGFAVYQHSRALELAKARQDAQHARNTLKKERQQQQIERERHEQRSAKGRAKARKNDMPKVLLDARKDRSEATGGRIAGKHLAMQQQEQARLRTARGVIGEHTPLAFVLTEPEPMAGCLVALADARVDRLPEAPPLNWQVMMRERWWLRGPNGCGKSTWLGVIHQSLPLVRGELSLRGRQVLLDQHLMLLNPDFSALDNFRQLNPGWSDTDYRERLALLRLRGDQALKPVRRLSGGERLKVALAVTLMGPNTAQLVLLDEPDNHLDLDSQSLLAEVLSHYTGTLIVVTHSEAFAKAINLDQALVL